MTAVAAGPPRDLYRVGRVLITGGSSGIGAATAEAFAARGFLVAVTGRDKAALDRVARVTGGVSIPGDLREPGCPRRVVDAAAAALGGLEVVVSNAGIGWAGTFTEMTEEEVDELLDGVVDTPYFDRRGVPYQRRLPRPIPAQVVADAIVGAVEQRRDTVVVPEWLGWPARLKGGFPALYRQEALSCCPARSALATKCRRVASPTCSAGLAGGFAPGTACPCLATARAGRDSGCSTG